MIDTENQLIVSMSVVTLPQMGLSHLPNLMHQYRALWNDKWQGNSEILGEKIMHDYPQREPGPARSETGSNHLTWHGREIPILKKQITFNEPAHNQAIGQFSYYTVMLRPRKNSPLIDRTNCCASSP
jgi:hypothetical protein